MVSVAFALSTSCANKKKTDDSGLGQSASGADMSGGNDSDSGKAEGLMTVNFPYDSFVLDSKARETLNSNVQILKSKSGLKVQIEGHCDERGSIQYNLALGEKRADATRKYIVDKGISGDRVTIISYGKERPLDQGSNESSWARNRRSNFVITSQ